MNLPQIVIIGAGGHAKVVADIILKIGRYQIAGHTAPGNPPPAARLKFRYLGNDNVLPSLWKQGVKLAALGVGGVGDNRPRRRIYEHIHSLGFSTPPLVHPAAIVADGVLPVEGLVIAPGAVVNPRVEFGVNTIINSAAVVEHDCVLGEHVHVAPGAVLCGGVRVGSLAHVGAGAVVIQGVALGEGAVVGAGAVVLHDVEPWTVVAGNPARFIKSLKEVF
ncbi:MAG: NeuD/PglB/VioB family sugar acetyltransferase [Bacillota bacterium]